MKHILSREEFLSNKEVNEGFFRDTLNKVKNKIASWFVAGMKKVKNFIVAFDNKGNVLPVITPQATLDHLSGADGVKVFASGALSNEIKELGGSACATKASYNEKENEFYSPYPKFNSKEEYLEWINKKGYEDTDEFKNALAFAQTLNENAEKFADDVLNEDMAKKYSVRKGYGKDADENINQAKVISMAKLKEELKRSISMYVNPKTITRKNPYTGETIEIPAVPPKPLCVFGAPGLGKSSIPRAVCDAWNDSVGDDVNQKVALVTVDIQSINPGDLLMPQFPDNKSVSDEIADAGLDIDAEIKGTSAYQNATTKKGKDAATDKITQLLGNLKMSKAKLSPQIWFPGYMKTSDEDVNAILDDLANCGTHTRTDKKSGTNRNVTEKTAGGGILFFDELFRAKPHIFTSLMNLFTKDRTLNGWTLGSKWFILGASNRPVDDPRISDTFWGQDSAQRDRWNYRVVEPDGGSWKEWAINTIYPDPIIIDYIFGDYDPSNDEYPRFQSDISQEDFASAGVQLKSVSPRLWEDIINTFNNRMAEDGKTSVADYSKAEIEDIVNEVADKDLAEHFADWVENVVKSIKLEEILKYNDDKGKHRKAAKLNDEQKKDVSSIMDILKDKIDKYIEQGGNPLTDDQMCSVYTWIAHMFPEYHESIASFEKFLPDFAGCPTETNKIIDLFPNTFKVIAAAFPRKELQEIWDGDDELDKEVFNKDKIIEIAKKDFPNNLDSDGNLIFMDLYE